MSKELKEKTYVLKLDLQTHIRLRKIEDFVTLQKDKFVTRNETVVYLINDFFDKHKTDL